MAKIVWDKTGERIYETGVEQGVLYNIDERGAYSKGVPWNGLTAVTESPSGAEATPLYADNIKYLELQSAEEFGATIEAYTYPDEFGECDGTASIGQGIIIGQQSRKIFGLSYKTVVGNDVKNNDYGYKLHLIYGAKAAPSEKAYSTINDSPEAITFSWEVTTTPVPVTDHKPTSTLVIDSTKVGEGVMKKIEDVLYGTEDDEPRLPLPDEVLTIISAGVGA
nr:MAG TPA: tail tube protein [Caudoviricetes sp.]